MAKPKARAKPKPATKPQTKTKAARAKTRPEPAAEPRARASAVAAAASPSVEEQAFLASIVADPADKKARLVYADQLQERGDPRGEFIVLQCTRDELRDDDPRAPELDAQIDALLAKHKKAWTAYGANKGARWVFRRGFAEKLSLDAADLVRNGDAIFAAEPIEELHVWKVELSPTKIANSRLAPILKLPLQRIREIGLRCNLTRDDIEALARASTLVNLEVLDLTNITGNLKTQLAPLATLALPRLRELRVMGWATRRSLRSRHRGP